MLNKTSKIIAALLIFTLTFANQVVLGQSVERILTISAEKELKAQSASANAQFNMTNKENAQTEEKQEEKEAQEENAKPLQLQTNVESLSKGKLYANHIAEENDYETNYETKLVLNMPVPETSTEKITSEANTEITTINMPEDVFYNKEGKELVKQSISNFKQTKINKSSFEEILGENGYIKIYNGTTLIGTIDMQSKQDEEENLIITYTQNYANLKIEISKPVKAGKLEIVNEKALNQGMSFTNEEIASIDKIETKANDETAQIKLEETTSNITVDIDRNKLSSVTENKDVNITVKLNNKDENTNLYKDPVIDIILPEEVENINLKQTDLLYAEGLEIKESKKGTIDGKQTIRVILEGTQKEFSSGILTEGTNLIVKADVTLKALSPNVTDKIEVVCQNQNEIAKALGMDLVGAEKEINVTAPEEVISISTIKTDDEGKEVTSLEKETQTGKIEILAEAKTKQMELKILNNYKTPVTGVTILGRIPVEGNKSPEKIDLGSNFSTTLKSEIQTDTEEAQIYYSEDANATKTLGETWKTAENIDLNKAKSYLIVFPEDYKLEAAQSLNFTYDFEVPEMLEHNSQTYATYTTYYTKEDGETQIPETAISNIVGLSTGTGPQFKVELTSNVEEGVLAREGQRIVYTVKVTNTGKETEENVTVTMPVPKNMNLVEYDGYKYNLVPGSTEKQFTIDSIKPDESKTFTVNMKITSNLPTVEEYYGAKKDENGKYYIEKATQRIELEEVEAGSGKEANVEIKGNLYYADYDLNEEIPIKIVEEDGKYYIDILEQQYIEENIAITAVAKVTAEKLEKEITAENTIKAVKSEIDIFTDVGANQIDQRSQEGEELYYTVTIKNKMQEALSNINLHIDFNKGLEYKGTYKVIANPEGGFQEEEIKNVYNNNSVDYTIKTLEAEDAVYLKIKVVVNNLAEDEYEKEITITPKITMANTTYSADPMTTRVYRANLVANQTCSEENSYVKEGDTFSYELTVENSGTVPTKDLRVGINIPEELIVQDMYYELAGNKIGMAKINKQEKAISIKEGQTLKIVATVQANKIGSGLTEKEITNTFTITEGTRNIEVNSISHTIEVNPNWEGPSVQIPDVDNPENPENPSSSGKTYKISGKVWLDQNKDGKYDEGESLQKDIIVSLINEAGDILKTTKTEANGNYTFTNLEKGKYIVAFVYDSNTYALTYYQKDGVAESLNSDVIGDKGNAITDTIEITDISIGNIDMGLIIKETFDLKLDKYVSKIVVQTSSGTKEYAQGNKTTLAKADIRAKELKGAKVIMEYKIVITNEGKTAGYAKEIVDYMPNDTEFSSELNSGWYQGSDGALHTTQLKDIVINPGESIALYLVLSRNMTEKNTNTVTNNAEIQKSYSIEQAEDTDSSAGNKKVGEDDLGSADIIIGVATGSRVLYITLGIVCMILLVEGIYFIKKKVLTK